MTDEDWNSIEYSVLVAAMPKELSREQREMWITNARQSLSDNYRPLVELLRMSHLTAAKLHGWKRPTN